MIEKNVECLLKKMNKTKYWLEHQMNMSTWNMNRLLRSKHGITYRKIRELCYYLKCTPNEIIDTYEGEFPATPKDT